MKIAFWTVTRGAGKIAKEYSKEIEKDLGYEVGVYTLEKYEIYSTFRIENFTKTLEENFLSYDAHIFIMASGIVIRKIAPLLRSKDTDPAILIIDEAKNFVISLLSGHLGGANELTRKISKLFNLVPIITTSSDITGKIAVDTIAQKLNSELEDLESAKNVTSLIVDGKEVEILLPRNVNIKTDGKSKNSDGLIIISNKKEINFTRIYPKNIILGIGCKKDSSKEKILEAIERCLDKNNIDIRSVKHFATIDLKQFEKGLIEASNNLNKALIIVNRDEILSVEDKFKCSAFVKENIGVGAVSGPVAFLTSTKKGKFLEEKFMHDGVTVSIYEEDLTDE